MNTVLLHTTSHPPQPLAPLGTLDRLALRVATSLISGVEWSRRRRSGHVEARRDRDRVLRERAHLGAELERERRRLDTALLFRHLA